MKSPIVIIGLGELGGVFAHGFLRSGHPVYPITRAMDISQECHIIPSPALVLITVQEDQLDGVLALLPDAWRNRVGLVQNELLPIAWQAHHLLNPSIVVVWFEKKKTMALSHILYTPIYGPKAAVLGTALQALDVPVKFLDSMDALLYELIRKTIYILTVNIAGLVTAGTVGELWSQHQELAVAVAEDAIAIQEGLIGQTLAKQKLIAGMVEGIEDCPHRLCVGRRARQRLERCLGVAQNIGINTPTLAEIYTSVVD